MGVFKTGFTKARHSSRIERAFAGSTENELLIADTREFFRSRAGRGFVVYVLLCAGLSAAIGYGVYQSNLRWFEASKSEEKQTALELADSFFATYSELRGLFPSDSVPVPATFRAHAIERFNRNRDSAETMRLVLVGVPGREIRVTASDADMAEAVGALAASADPRPTTRRIMNGDQPVLRTIHPSIASQMSCVQCHNAIQPGERWQLNDVMGAFALDVPLAAFLRQTRREAVLIAGTVFVLACGVGLYVFFLQFRAFASEIYKRLSDAVENLTDGFAIYDAQGRLVLSNPVHRRLAAYIELSRFRLSAAASDAAPRVVSQEVALPGNTWLNVQEIRTLSGDVVRVETDISVLKQREIEMGAAKNEAERASRAKTRFLALMSHELRTPLNAIIGYSEVIGREMFGPVNDRYRSYAGDIHQSGQHLLAVISDILDISKVEAGKVELEESLVDASEAVAACCRLVSAQAAAAGLALTSDIPPALHLQVDATRFKQVILNLLSNSVKFTPQGGAVSVTASIAGHGAATFTVADTGIGMRANEIPRALAAFEQVDNRTGRRYGGTGLGLPIAKMLAVAHGGSLTIDSAPGQGTRVIVTLPANRVVERNESIAS